MGLPCACWWNKWMKTWCFTPFLVVTSWAWCPCLGDNGRFQAGAEAAGSKTVINRNLEGRWSQPSPSFQMTDREQNVVRKLAPGCLVITGYPWANPKRPHPSAVALDWVFWSWPRAPPVAGHLQDSRSARLRAAERDPNRTPPGCNER